eukprot:12628661-Heterocapsa_arctica.AAC.1
MNPEGLEQSYRVCAPIGRLCGHVAAYQLHEDRDYIAEQPDPSLLFDERPWPSVRARPKNVIQDLCQCVTGQRVGS